MTAYFIRRLLLVPLTFIAITFLVYAIVRVLPGGPVEQAQMRRRLAAMAGEGGGGGVSRDANLQLDEDALKALQRYYALDRPIPIGYLQWLGAWPRPVSTRVPQSTLTKYQDVFRPLQQLAAARAKLQGKLASLLGAKDLIAYQDQVYRVMTPAEIAKLDPNLVERARRLAAAGYGNRDRLLGLLAPHGLTWAGEGNFYTRSDGASLLKQAALLFDGLRMARQQFDEVARRYGYEVDDDGTINKVDEQFSGVLELDFGRSYTHSEPVMSLIAARLPISAQLGLIGYVLTWLVCVPLGIVKAIRHRTALDTATSLLVFIAYSIPGYVVSMLLIAGVATHGWLPLGDWYPPGAGFGERVRHMAIPMVGYMMASFATMTILTKNSLLENLTADYVRTALAKGLTERRTIWVHALRNSLIPLTANIGSAAAVLFAGSFLIEKVTNVDGMGLLGWNALLQRDYPIVLGTLVIGVLIQLFGGIVSDLVWAFLDPRIRFEVRS